MDSNQLIFWLFAVTLLLGLAIGIVQLMRVRRSQTRRGERPTPALTGDADRPAATHPATADRDAR